MSRPPPAPDSIALVTERPRVLASNTRASLSLAEDRDRLTARLDALGARVEVLVNNAGFGIYEPFVQSGRERKLNLANSIQTLAQKLQAAGQAGDSNAREWLLDLKQIALDVKDEQIQVNGLLQAIHAFVDNSHQQYQQQYQQYQQAPQQMGGGMFGGGGGGGGMLGGFLNSGFGRAMEMGAGIGIGEDLINSIF